MSDYHKIDANQASEDVSTQEGRILAKLQEAYPGWVSALDLARISLQYSARVHSLRHKRHLSIENRLDRLENGSKRGFFRLSPPPITPRDRDEDKSIQAAFRKQPQTSKPVLFPDLHNQHRDLG